MRSPWSGFASLLGTLLLLWAPGFLGLGSGQTWWEEELRSRTGDCPICDAMVREKPVEHFEPDAHTFSCQTCHHPHTKRSVEEWKNTCTSSGCHPRAWTKTVFHRVEPAAFADCLNCHKAHTWRLDGNDCASCHGGAGPEKTVAAPEVEGFESFPHSRHGQIPCSTCHSTEKRHADLIMTSREACQSCHHAPANSTPDACRTCHGGREPVPSRKVKVAFEVLASGSPTRNLVFDHSRHASLVCTACHEASQARTVLTTCDSCHGDHHGQEADCASCHATPPDNAHDLAVHETGCAGSGCHGDRIAEPSLTRSLCLSCHPDQLEHRDPQKCASCHMVGPR